MLLRLGETGAVRLLVSQQVIAETERNLARKAPDALPAFRLAIKQARVRIVRDPSSNAVAAAQGLVSHPADVPVLLAAMQARVDYLVTFNRKHFLEDPQVALRAGILIGLPGDALAWVRAQLTSSGSLPAN